MLEKTNPDDQSGQSLVELVIALALFALMVAGWAGLFMIDYAGVNRSADLTAAEGLAQEALAAAEAIRHRAWNELVYQQSAVTIADSRWTLAGEGTSEQIGKFRRQLELDARLCRCELHNYAVLIFHDDAASSGHHGNARTGGIISSGKICIFV